MKEIRLLEQNFVLLSGYLARDPDVRVTQKGSTVCHFSVGATRRYRDKASGDWKDETAWVPVDVWGDAAERLRDKLKKGTPVHVEGRLRTRSYEDKSGQKRTTLEVVARRVQFLAKQSSDATSKIAAPAGKSEVDLEDVPF